MAETVKLSHIEHMSSRRILRRARRHIMIRRAIHVQTWTRMRVCGTFMMTGSGNAPPNLHTRILRFEAAMTPDDSHERKRDDASESLKGSSIYPCLVQAPPGLLSHQAGSEMKRAARGPSTARPLRLRIVGACMKEVCRPRSNPSRDISHGLATNMDLISVQPCKL